MSNETFEKAVYECTLCKACETKCPMNVEICKAIKNARKILVAQGKEPTETKKIIENIQKTGNIYGIKETD
jgi:heterodisulfide reductase subunit C